MASDTDSADVTELTERNEDSGLSGVDKRKEIDVLLVMEKQTNKNKSCFQSVSLVNIIL